MKKSLVVLLAVALMLLVPACRKSAPAQAAKPATPPPPGMIIGEIRTGARQLGTNQTYSVEYTMTNGSSLPLRVRRLETGTGALTSGSPGWQQSDIPPGKSALVALVMARTTAAGPLKLTAAFVTDQGVVDAPPVTIDVAATAPAAPPAGSGTISAIVTVAPNPVKAGQTALVIYELVNPTNQEILVASIQGDSAAPFTRDSDGWLSDRVGPGGRVTILRRSVTPKQPGSYTFPAQFNTSKGLIAAPAAALAVEPSEQQVVDTGHVNVAIQIMPNPAHIDQPYVIDYQVINTTLKPVTVTAIQTDIGTYQESSPEWVSGTAGPRMTTVIARLRSTGMAIGARTKTAVFSTSAGMLPASPVVLTVER
jgi:hypothetical protein